MSYPSSDRTFDLIPAGGRVGGMTAQDLASRRPQEEDTLLHGNPSCQHPPWTLDSEQLECEALLYMAPSQDVPEEGGGSFIGTFSLKSQESLASLEPPATPVSPGARPPLTPSPVESGPSAACWVLVGIAS